MFQRARAYYSLTKPGVLYGNAITVVAGFLLASHGSIDLPLFSAVFIGTSLIIASACALNNYLDQDIDSKMERTKKRAIVNGDVKGAHAAIFAGVIGLLGLITLIRFTNYLVVIIGLLGYLTYVVFYGMLSKRLSIHGTLVGSISGAMPILAGYVAAHGRIDCAAVLLFMAVFFWQMPEFYSIAIYRRHEYKAAGIPVISVVKGVPTTVIHILLFTILFVLSSLALTPAGYTGISYLIIMSLLGLYWLYLAIQGVRLRHNHHQVAAWARQMFHMALIVLVVYSILISIDWLLP